MLTYFACSTFLISGLFCQAAIPKASYKASFIETYKGVQFVNHAATLSPTEQLYYLLRFEKKVDPDYIQSKVKALLEANADPYGKHRPPYENAFQYAKDTENTIALAILLEFACPQPLVTTQTKEAPRT